jgi:hypothetical protein
VSWIGKTLAKPRAGVVFEDKGQVTAGRATIIRPMVLTPGTLIGPYEVVALLGEGGMGQVYRARDGKLNREVALKILPDLFTADPDRLARFRREAQVLASLNHPHIAQIYGFEDSGATHALVLELVPGGTLADRLAIGSLPLAEALPIARQIADSVAAAHDAGVVHRDLKPANIKVTDDGLVKVLDFGLAKTMTTSRAGISTSDASDLTMTSPVMTQMGMILGTAAYMSPEQARGKAVDRRADVWAFGCVLYEMLTGRRAFAGDEVTDVLAAVLKESPPLDALPPGVPPQIRKLLQRCLEKDRARRLDSLSVARLDIDEAIAGKFESDPRPPARPRGGILAGVAAASLVAGSLATFAAWQATTPAPSPVQVRRVSLVSSAELPLDIEANHIDLAFADDGSRVAYLARDARTPQRERALVMRSMDTYETRALTGLGSSPRSTFLSPDGAWLAYQSGAGRMLKSPVAGGSPVPIAEFEGNLRGASWTRDGSIIFATHFIGTGLLRVSENGGPTETLTMPSIKDNESDHVWPHVLPGGKHVLFTIRRSGTADAYDVALLSLDTKTWRVLAAGGSSPRYVSPGYILYARAGALYAVGFDLDKLQVTTEPVQALDGVVTKTSGAANFAVSRDGTLMYMPGQSEALSFNVALLDRAGRLTPVPVPARAYRGLRVSPDGRFLVASVETESVADNQGLWTIDLARGTSDRLTSPGVVATSPVWHPQSQAIAYWSPPGKEPGGIFQIATTGTGSPRRLTTSTNARHLPTSWSPDGRHLLFTNIDVTGADIHRVVLGDTPAVEPVLAGARPEGGAKLSPDGRWMLYGSGETGGSGVHLRPYPDVNRHRTPIVAGSAEPFWGKDSSEIIIAGQQAVESIQLDSSSPPRPSTPRAILQSKPTGRIPPIDDVLGGGERFVVYQQVIGAQAPPIEYRVVFNWITELESLMRSAARK